MLIDKSPDLLISSVPQEESISVKRDRLPYKDVAHFVHTPLTDLPKFFYPFLGSAIAPSTSEIRLLIFYPSINISLNIAIATAHSYFFQVRLFFRKCEIVPLFFM
ncbi:hypothetical protein QUA13_00805 [Microcoleus sp. S28C3]|uniref:hypothetical protein n=1 Tax=Microcoleus sp. S28C3 TaxID=3055414 RepID=UPI002FD70BE2